jgi:hypothetical protein
VSYPSYPYGSEAWFAKGVIVGVAQLALGLTVCALIFRHHRHPQNPRVAVVTSRTPLLVFLVGIVVSYTGVTDIVATLAAALLGLSEVLFNVVWFGVFFALIADLIRRIVTDDDDDDGETQLVEDKPKRQRRRPLRVAWRTG